MIKTKVKVTVESREKERKPRFKRVKKGPVTFHVKLTEEQKTAKAIALANTVTFLTGKPGTSKSLLACNIALDLLIKDEVEKIILTRPTVVAARDIGFLPGDAFDFKEGKLAPFISPILQAMYKLRDREEIDAMIQKDKIQIAPLAFIRGHNFEDCVVIADEFQNATADELKALTTRLCSDSRLILTSDVNQIDLREKNNSASKFVDAISKLDGVAVIELMENFRHPLALEIMDVVDKLENTNVNI